MTPSEWDPLCGDGSSLQAAYARLEPAGTPLTKARPCVPEWCEEGGPVHDDVCDNAPMHPMTKHEWVEFLKGAAAQAITAYRVLTEDEEGVGFGPEEAAQLAVDEVDESATCYAGIGSCGRGWCKHS